jgi:hypothetical protein
MKSFTAFWFLLRADLHVLRQQIVPGWINIGLWASISLVVFTYLLPSAHSLGMFLVPGCIIVAQLFDIYSNVVYLVGDFENDQVMLQRMSLPIASWIVWLEQIIFFAIRMLSQSLLVLPLSWPLLGNLFDLSQLCIWQFFLTIIFSALLFGAGSVCLASFTPTLSHIRNIWARMIFPMWFLGGYMFSWKTLYQASPYVAYCDLANPVMHATEAMRCAMLGAQGSLPFLYTLSGNIFFTIACTAVAIIRLNKRLDIP